MKVSNPTRRASAGPALRRCLRLALLASWWPPLALTALSLTVLALACWLALPWVPLPAALVQPPAATWEFQDRNGRPLRLARPNGAATPTARTPDFSRPATLPEIPPALVQATVAAEDQRFWGHPGVDWRANLRALADLVRHRRVISGASTLTQQLIKLAEPRPRTVWTKLIEAAQALRLEQVWDKQRILAAYLNRLDYGHLNTGCAAAAAFYFNKPLPDLSPAECAFLAGLPQAPTRLNPHRHFDRARKRQHWILTQMRRHQFLSEPEFQRARSEPLRLAPPRRPFAAPHFVELLMRELPAAPPAGSPARVRTTLDLDLQTFAEETVRRHLARLEPHQARNAAAVILDNRSGDVLALVGSQDYFDPAGGQVNGAWAPRSAGSTLKPFTYLLAFEQGANAATTVADIPTEFATPTGVYAPVNYDRRWYGPMRYRLALANSLNLPAVKVLNAVGGPAVLLNRLQACGLSSLTNSPNFYGLGLTLGNAEVRLLELANAYACLARLGRFKPFRLTLAPLLTPTPPANEHHARVANPDAAWLVADILSDNSARALAFGLDSDLNFPFPVACKTGTSSDFRDNWAMAYTPEFTVGVWIGNFDGTPMNHVSGVTGAAPVMQALFLALHHRFGTAWFTPPDPLLLRHVHPVTGKQLAPTAPPHSAAILEKFIPPNLPPLEQPDDYDASGRVRLSPEYRAWFESGDNWLRDQAALMETQPALRILSPLPGTVFFLDPDLPPSSRTLRLRAEGPGPLRWNSDSLACETQGNHAVAHLAAGRHTLVLSNPATGEHRETWIVVKRL